MKKALFTLLLSSLSLGAHQLFTPLLLERGALNKPYTDIFKDEPWWVSFWVGGYERSATCALIDNNCKTPLAALYFNKTPFTAQEAFAHATAISHTNFLLDSSSLRPQLRYKEKGIMLGSDLQHYISSSSRIGLRATLPLRKISIHRSKNRIPGKSDLGGLTIRDLFGERLETVDGIKVTSFAYRLDLLSRLPYTCKACPEAALPIVMYADTDFPPNNPISISKQDITNQQDTPVSALKSGSQTVPQTTWAIAQATAEALPPIAADGTLSGQNSRGRFDASVNYIPLGFNSTNQAQLFIVPSVAQGKTTQEARVIQAHVNEVLACIDSEAEDIFKKCGLSFASQCSSGAGDLDTELYAGHFFTPCLYAEAFVGLKWPTGKLSKNPQLIFKEPLGTNGHYTGKIGAQAILKTCRWAALQADIAGFFVAQDQECVLASFVGAQLKNLGPRVKVTTRWNYLIAHAELFITPPDCYGLGAVVGYELYHKNRDHISFYLSATTDCLGAVQPMSSRVATTQTCVTGHKIRGELFIEPCSWFVLAGGGSYVVSGKNCPQEKEWYLSISTYF